MKACSSARSKPTRRPAAAAFKSGDVILKWNDHVATDPTLLSRAIAATEIGSTAKLRARAREDGEDKETARRSNVKVERRPESTTSRPLSLPLAEHGERLSGLPAVIGGHAQ